MTILRAIALVAAFLILFGIAFSLDNYVLPVSDSAIAYPTVTEPAPLPLAGKTIVNFGDSIFGNFKAPVDISSYLADLTGAAVYNVGFGGCRMSQHPAEQYNAFSMYNLAYAIVNNDWTLQDQTMARTDWTPHNTYAGHLAALKTIDFNTVDIITISYGTNDFAGSSPLFSNDPKDIVSFAGGLRTSIELIQTAYPHIEIVLCTPTYRFWIDKENNTYLYDSNTHRINGRKLADFVQTTKDIAQEYNLLCIDNYNGCGITAANRSECFPENDGTHPNETGRKMIAQYMATVLLERYA